MNCDKAKVFLHGLVDDEIDKVNADRIGAHLGACARCAAQLRLHLAMRAMMSNAGLRFSAPPRVRTRIDAMLPVAAAVTHCRRTLFKGFAFGSALPAVAAALLMIGVIRSDRDQAIVGDVVSAHLRSLQVDHLTEVQTSDQQALRPWLAERLAVAPPVPELSSQGFNLVGARIDYVLGKAVAAIVYRRSDQVISLFVAQGAQVEQSARVRTTQGLNVALWSEKGFNLCAVGALRAEELEEFRKKFEAAAWAGRS